MPKLDLQSSHQFWRDYGDMTIYRVISFMESVETWTKDGDPKLETALDELGEALESLSKLDMKEEELFIKIATFLKMPRLLRMLQAIDSISPGSASKVLMYSEEKAGGSSLVSLFLKRNVVFERLRLLSRVFSSERFNLITKALENE